MHNFNCKTWVFLSSRLDGVIFPSQQTFSDSNHPDFPGPLLPEDKKKRRNKRAPKSGDRAAPRCKKRKKEEDVNQAMYSSTEPVMTQLKQVQLKIIFIFRLGQTR